MKMKEFESSDIQTGNTLPGWGASTWPWRHPTYNLWTSQRLQIISMRQPPCLQSSRSLCNDQHFVILLLHLKYEEERLGNSPWRSNPVTEATRRDVIKRNMIYLRSHEERGEEIIEYR